jgi:hypothetical protein
VDQDTYDTEDPWSPKVGVESVVGEFKEVLFNVLKFGYVFGDLFKGIEFLVCLFCIFTFPHVPAQAQTHYHM